MKRFAVRSVPLVFMLAMVFVPLTASAQTVVGVGANAFFEDSKLNGLQQIAVQENDESYEYRSDGFLTGGFWFLFQMGDRIRAGSMIDYYGTYASLTKCQENECDNPDFEPDRFEFGKLVEFFGRFEYGIPMTESTELILGTVFGLPILFPGGDLEAEITSLREQGASVLNIPRIGYLVGPNLAGRWKYSEHLAVRADLMVKWEQMFLFRTSQSIDGISFRKNWTTGSLRYEIGVGIEVAL
jgi:hypothetical protein